MYQPLPSRDSSAYLPVVRQVDIPTITIRRFFDTDVPFPGYHVVVNLVRGYAGAPIIPPTVPPGQGFVDTPPWAREFLRSDNRIFLPLFGSFDPLSAGAFFATPIPWLGPTQTWRIEGSVIIPSIVPPALVVPEQQRTFLMFLSYQWPWLRDASMVSAPNIFGGVAPLVPLELRRFASHEWAWRVGWNYQVDASWFSGPQSWIKIPPAPPAGHKRMHPLWMRRLKLLKIRTQFPRQDYP